ncbi:hypothetical protein HYV64_01035 [Candidatus Shapirobacteria bacterium]|nr:hypothetical protein [Candidatus Shapirobacteria bacterium]
MKIIVIGASLSGKTTLVRYLQEHNINCSEIDEELTTLNGGSYPTDVDKKHHELVPKIVADIIARPDVLFFTNTDYFTLDDLRLARASGFKIYQLDISLSELIKRNKRRIEGGKYEDMSPWLEDMVDYQNELKKTGLIDKSIDATQPVEKIAKEIKQ